MPLLNNPIYSSNCQLADWAEFKALISHFNHFSIADFTNLLDDSQESENENIAFEDNEVQLQMDRLYNEIDFRIRSIGSAYPFFWSDDMSVLQLKDELTIPNHIYLFCLFLSHYNNTEIIDYDPEVNYQVRDLFQVCSTLAAAGLINGSAITFGVPRKIETAFLDALKTTYSRMGEGSIVPSVPDGAPKSPKDDGVDIIAWKNHNDGYPGKHYILGQVATGQDWLDKSLKGHIDTFHDTWFSSKPFSTALTAIFIPFCIEPNSKEGSISARIGYLSRQFGFVIYRYRLALLAEIGISTIESHGNSVFVDRFSEIENVSKYVTKEIASLRNS